MKTPWRALEEIPGLIALPVTWRARTGDDFENFSALCLKTSQWLPRSYPCPRDPGCAFHIVPISPSRDDPHPAAPKLGAGGSVTKNSLSPSDGERAGVRAPSSDSQPSTNHPQPSHTGTCEGHPPTCEPIHLTLTDITPLELNWPKLARATSKAFGLDTKIGNLPIPHTIQIGSWSADSVPVILTIQTERHHLHFVISDLIARLHQKFILFAPTTRNLDASSQELLANANAAFFPLETTVILTPNGTLQPTKPPGELFAKFIPQPKELDEDVARRAFALVKQFDSDGPKNPPSLLTVFRLYCIEELSAGQIAKKCECSKAAIVRRLILIRAKTGADPRALRRLSVHLDKIDQELSNPDARRIHPKRLIDDADQDPDPQ